MLASSGSRAQPITIGNPTSRRWVPKSSPSQGTSHKRIEYEAHTIPSCDNPHFQEYNHLASKQPSCVTVCTIHNLLLQPTPFVNDADRTLLKTRKRRHSYPGARPVRLPKNAKLIENNCLSHAHQFSLESRNHHIFRFHNRYTSTTTPSVS